MTKAEHLQQQVDLLIAQNTLLQQQLAEVRHIAEHAMKHLWDDSQMTIVCREDPCLKHIRGW